MLHLIFSTRLTTKSEPILLSLNPLYSLIIRHYSKNLTDGLLSIRTYNQNENYVVTYQKHYVQCTFDT